MMARNGPPINPATAVGIKVKYTRKLTPTGIKKVPITMLKASSNAIAGIVFKFLSWLAETFQYSFEHLLK